MQGERRAERRRSRCEEKRGPQWSALQEYARAKIQGWIQNQLEEGITELLGRGKSERRAAVDAGEGYRNAYGKPGRIAMMAGTVTVRYPRARGLEERCESWSLPLFVRRSEAVGELVPQLYLPAGRQAWTAWRRATSSWCCGAVGRGGPLSACSIERLRVKWQLEDDQWSQRRGDEPDVVYAWADGVYVKAYR